MYADLLIIGGGPAGLATAIHGAQSGLSAVVVERHGPPLDKACGEGLMPLGLKTLDRLGVVLPVGAGVPLAGVRFRDGAVAAEGCFAGAGGLGLRRTVLMAALRARATELGVTLHDDCRALAWRDRRGDVAVDTTMGRLRGRWIVGADGLHSRVRRSAGLARPTRARPRYGVRRHFTVAPWSRFVEIHWADGTEAYVTPTGPSTVNVALLWGGGGDFDTVLARFPALTERLAGASACGPAQGAGPFRQRVASRVRGNVALVGDAAGYLDPLTGEGVTLGMRTAVALVDVLARRRPLVEYERAYRRLVRGHVAVTQMLLAIAARPALRRRTIAALAASPRSFARLVEVASGERPLGALGPVAMARLAAAFLRATPPAVATPELLAPRA